MNNYVPLHNHTDYSIPFDGFQTIEEMVSRVKELGMNAVCLSDHGTLSGHIPFFDECVKNEIKPLIGVEVYFVPEFIKERNYYHLVLIAKNNIGLLNLRTLVSKSYEQFYYKPRVSWDLLQQYSDGLICLSACMASIINTENGEKWAENFKYLFKNDFFLEIQANFMQEQQIYNEKVIYIAKKFNIPLIISTDSHYSRIEDAKYHKLWVNINKEENEYYPTEDFYIKSIDEIYSCLLPYIKREIIDEALKNTQLIADQCDVSIMVEGNHYPEFQCDDPLEEVKRICREGWLEKIVNRIPEEEQQKYIDRFNYEIKVLEKCNYLNYLLILQDILGWCKKNGILTGPGRGSAAGSLVCYLMSITHLDPIQHNLLFERFVHEYRVTAADIDSDIDKERRDEVIEYVKNKYGTVYNIRTFNALSDKGATQRAGQALRMEPQEVIKISTSIESIDDIQEHEELRDVAKHFLGRIANFGCHASAVLVFPDNPYAYCTIERQGDTYLAAADYHDLEKMNLLKLDLLGLANLTVINKTCKLINEKIDIYHLPLDKHEVYKQYADGLTSSIFQAESAGMANLAKQTKVDRFEDIVALVSLYRPGPLDSGMAQQFVDGKNGGQIKYLHPSLEPILKNTYGVIVYQEQVQKIAQVMAGMNVGEADSLRRIIGRKELDKIEEAVNDFIQRSINNGYSKEIAEEIGRQIKACGRYIFNLSHAAAYGMVSYITAYLKCFYPLQYMCSVLNNEIGDVTKISGYIAECQRMGIAILPPSVRYSKPQFIIENDAIRYGLNAIKGVGSTEFVSASSFDEFITKNTVDSGTLKSLIQAGAFFEPIGILMGKLDWITKYQKRVNQCNEKINEFQRKGNEKKVLEWQQKLAEVSDIDEVIPIEVNESRLEKEVLGFNLQFSPFKKYLQYLNGYGTLNFEQFKNKPMFKGRPWVKDDVEKGSIVIGGMLENIQEKKTKSKNEPFGVGNLRTVDNGTIKVCFFGKQWKDNKKELLEYNNTCMRIKAIKKDETMAQGIAVHFLEKKQGD